MSDTGTVAGELTGQEEQLSPIEEWESVRVAIRLDIPGPRGARILLVDG